jgi:hypothetical protein
VPGIAEGSAPTPSPRSKITRLTAIAVLAVLMSGLAYAWHTDWGACRPASVISTETEAIAKARELIAERGLFYFDGVGGARQILKRLDEQPHCCEALRSSVALKPVWEVGLQIAEDGKPRHYMHIIMTRCGGIVSRGKITEY